MDVLQKNVLLLLKLWEDIQQLTLGWSLMYDSSIYLSPPVVIKN